MHLIPFFTKPFLRTAEISSHFSPCSSTIWCANKNALVRDQGKDCCRPRRWHCCTAGKKWNTIMGRMGKGKSGEYYDQFQIKIANAYLIHTWCTSYLFYITWVSWQQSWCLLTHFLHYYPESIIAVALGGSPKRGVRSKNSQGSPLWLSRGPKKFVKGGVLPFFPRTKFRGEPRPLGPNGPGATEASSSSNPTGK